MQWKLTIDWLRRLRQAAAPFPSPTITFTPSLTNDLRFSTNNSHFSITSTSFFVIASAVTSWGSHTGSIARNSVFAVPWQWSKYFTNTTDLFTVFEAILTGRQRRQKLPESSPVVSKLSLIIFLGSAWVMRAGSLYENLMSNISVNKQFWKNMNCKLKLHCQGFYWKKGGVTCDKRQRTTFLNFLLHFCLGKSRDSRNFIRLLRVVITPSWEEKTTRSNQIRLVPGKITDKYMENLKQAFCRN